MSLLVVSAVVVLVVSPSVATASIVLKGSLSRMLDANERLVDMGEIKLSLGPGGNCCVWEKERGKGGRSGDWGG